LVTDFAVESGLTINATAARSLYTGMVTDSGRFRYDGTTARTFRLASKLMEAGIDTNELFRDLYADNLASKQLKAQFTMKIQLSAGNVAYIYTTLEEFQALGVDTFTASRAMVNTMADIKGVDIWVNFTETDKGVLCELRSNRFNINPIAVKYGGGGHQKASGATVADRATAMAMLADLDELRGE
jgi:phosphoesterase RecJ-like protein